MYFPLPTMTIVSSSIALLSQSTGEIHRAEHGDTSERLTVLEMVVTGNDEICFACQGTLQYSVVRFIIRDGLSVIVWRDDFGHSGHQSELSDYFAVLTAGPLAKHLASSRRIAGETSSVYRPEIAFC